MVVALAANDATASIINPAVTVRREFLPICVFQPERKRAVSPACPATWIGRWRWRWAICERR